MTKMNKEELYRSIVECAMRKRKLARALLEEAEQDMVKARDLLGDEFIKEEEK